MCFWGISQWYNSSRYKHHFWKALGSNLFANKYLKCKCALKCWTENNCSRYIIFHWLLNLSEKEDFVQCTYKKSSRRIYFIEDTHILFSQFSFFCIIGCIIFQSKQNFFECMYELFFNLMFEVRTDNTYQENYLYILRDLYSAI